MGLRRWRGSRWGGQVCALVILFPPFGSDNSENEMQQTCKQAQAPRQNSRPLFQGVKDIQWCSLATPISEIPILLLQLIFSTSSPSLLLHKKWSCVEANRSEQLVSAEQCWQASWSQAGTQGSRLSGWKSSGQGYLVHTVYSFYSDPKWATGSMVENTLQPSCWLAKAPRESSPSPYRGGGQCIQWSLPAPPLSKIPCRFGRAPVVSHFSTWSPPLVCSMSSQVPIRSCCSLYRCIF